MKRKALKPHNDPAFPMEVLFPGIHAARPDIAAQEAENFLAFGSGPTGSPLDAAAIRHLTGPAEQFIDFQVNPLPAEWKAIVDAVPDWAHPAAEEAARLLLVDLRRRVPGLRPDLTVWIEEANQVWICALERGFMGGKRTDGKP